MNKFPEVQPVREKEFTVEEEEGEVVINTESIFQMIRTIRDPEHSYTLEELKVVQLDRIKIEKRKSGTYVRIVVVPTIPHCSMVGLIGLSILYKLTQIVSSKYIIRVEVEKNSHSLSEEVTKQLADIERTYAAFLNDNIVDAILPLVSNR